ncbi:MAG: chromate efflux transporter [Bacteroidetes bacterium]|nr:MAG: chromate efflux transporter [Bacteroidota bacterium]
MKQLALLFLKLGATAFGGPAVHIAMMEDEVVKRRQWLTHEHFLDLIGATNLIPGPNSTEMAIHVGYLREGWKGVIVAGVCFIVPAAIITTLSAYLYVTYGSIPELSPFISGIRAAIIAIILAAVFRLSKPVVKNRFIVITGSLVIILSLFGVNEIVLLFASGAIGLLWNFRKRLQQTARSMLRVVPLAIFQTTGATTVAVQSNATLTGLGLLFLKIGSILYGSGYVLIAFLQEELVNTRHWLTQSQLLDAIAVGQFTPGPLSSTATFIGYVLLGLPGAFIATAGMFLPSFIFVVISNPFIPKLRKSPLARGFLDGVNAAALGLMVAVTYTLASTALTSIGTWIIFVLAVVVMLRWNLNSGWIVVGAAALGWMSFYFRF